MLCFLYILRSSVLRYLLVQCIFLSLDNTIFLSTIFLLSIRLILYHAQMIIGFSYSCDCLTLLTLEALRAMQTLTSPHSIVLVVYKFCKQRLLGRFQQPIDILSITILPTWTGHILKFKHSLQPRGTTRLVADKF